MLKKHLTLGIIATFVFTTGLALADTVTVKQIQSPIYTDDIGRAHFLGKGGYSTTRHIQMGEANAAAINDAANKLTTKTTTDVKNKVEETEKDVKKVENKIENKVQENVNKAETNIMDVIKEKPVVPVADKGKATFTSEQRKMDASAPFGYGMTNIPSGVNESKTMYTDGIGRLHFFGKGNIVKE